MTGLPVNEVINGECREVMQGFPSDSIDLVVTSPPYWGLRDYGVDEQLGLEAHPQLYIDHLVEICREVKRVIKPTGSFWLNLGDTYFSNNKQTGRNDTNSETSTNFKGWSNWEGGKKKLGPVMNNNWLQPKQLLGIPWRVASALQEDGWILRNCVVWHKPNHMPESVRDRLTKSYEFFFFFVKQRKYYYNLDAIREPYSDVSIKRLSQPNLMHQMGGEKQAVLYGNASGNGNRPADILKGLAQKYQGKYKGSMDPEALGEPRARTGIREVSEGNINGKNPGDMWSIPTQPFPGSHFAVFPEKLIEPIIKASSPKKGIILDPFAGSGTTCYVARRLSRRFIGIELNPEYAEMARERVRGRTFKHDLSDVEKLTQYKETDV